MASNSLTQHARFVEMMCEEAEPNFPYQTDELEAALNDARHLLTLQQVDAIWEAAMTMLSTATEGSFKAGWQLRGQMYEVQ